MKEVIKTVKAELERLRPIVDEFNRLENLLAFLEGQNNIDDETIKKRGNNGEIEIRIDASMPEDIRNKYNLNIGDTFNSITELSKLIHVSKNTIYCWKDKDGFIKSTKNNKRVCNNSTSVKITYMMPQKFQNKYGIIPGDFWDTIDNMRDKLGISLPTVRLWRKQKYIEFF